MLTSFHLNGHTLAFKQHYMTRTTEHKYLLSFLFPPFIQSLNRAVTGSEHAQRVSEEAEKIPVDKARH